MKIEVLNQLDEIDIQLTDLIRLLNGFENSALQMQPASGVWSPAQLVCHMYLAEKISFSSVKKKLSFNPGLKRVDIRHGFKSKLMEWLLASSIKLKAPEGVGTEFLVGDLTISLQMEKWLDLRKEMREYLSSLDEDLFYKDVYDHPVTGRQSLGQMVDFFSCHLKRHRKQLEARLPGVT